MFTKTLLTLLAVMSSTTLAAPAPMKYKRAMLDAMDYKIVNLALNLENLELNLYNQALTNFTSANYTSAGYTNGAMITQMVELLRDQETAHVALLEATLMAPSFVNCTYQFPVTTPQEFFTFSQIVTSVGEGAYLGALANISAPAVIQASGQIIGNEARQNSYQRTVLGLDFFNAPDFDTPLSANQAYSLAEPYLTCPSTNPAFNLTLFNPLTAAFANTNTTKHVAGEAIQITWDATKFYLGQDVHIGFLSGMHSLMSPLNQTSANAGMGMTTLPVGINGTAFLVATNFQGEGPIPDGQNFAIGALVVA